MGDVEDYDTLNGYIERTMRSAYSEGINESVSNVSNVSNVPAPVPGPQLEIFPSFPYGTLSFASKRERDIFLMLHSKSTPTPGSIRMKFRDRERYIYFVYTPLHPKSFKAFRGLEGEPTNYTPIESIEEVGVRYIYGEQGEEWGMLGDSIHWEREGKGVQSIHIGGNYIRGGHLLGSRDYGGLLPLQLCSQGTQITSYKINSGYGLPLSHDSHHLFSQVIIYIYII